MGRRKIIDEKPEEETLNKGSNEDADGVFDESEEIEPEEADEVSIRRVLADLGADGVDINITVYRVDPKTKKNEYITRCLPEDFSLEGLREDWGGGKYKIYARNAGGEFVINRSVMIAPPLKKPQQAQDDVMSVITRMGDMQAQQMADFKTTFLELLVKNQQPAAADPGAMMTTMVSAMAALQQMMPKPERSSDKNFETFMKGLEFGKDLNNEGGEAGLMDLAKEFIKQAGKPIAQMAVMEKMKHKLPPQKTKKITGSQGAATTAPTGPEGAEKENGEDQMNFMLVKQIKYLVGRAEADCDPSLYAEWVYDQIPGFYKERFETFVHSEDALEKIIELVPAAEEYKWWFGELLRFLTMGDDETVNSEDDLTKEGGTDKENLPPHDQAGEAD